MLGLKTRFEDVTPGMGAGARDLGPQASGYLSRQDALSAARLD